MTKTTIFLSSFSDCDRLLSGNGSDALVIFKNMLITCCIGIEIGHFFQRQRCVVGKKKLFVNLRFFAVWLRDGIYMCRGKSIGTMTTQKPNVVQCKSQLLDKEQTALLKLKQHWQNPPSLSHWQIHHLYAT